MTIGFTARARLWLLVALSLVIGASLACGDGGGKAAAGAAKAGPREGGGGANRGPQAFPVEVAEVEARDVSLVIPAVGSVDAFERVQVTARVSGVVERVRFSEGDTVKRDQVLVEIEPQRYQVAIRSAKAALERVKATQAEAAAALARREQAVATSPGLIPAEELETWRTKRSLAAAEEMEAKARYDEAALNLRDAYVRAPTAGTIETRNVQTGQFMQPGVVLATLVQRDPLLLRFQVPEASAGKLDKGMNVAFTVQGDPSPFRATVTHVAALADVTTRMVPVTAEVDEEHRDKLRPGSFAEVTVSLGTTNDAPIVPEIAVRPSERGFLAYVVEQQGERHVARERIVTLGMHTSDGHVEVRDGLKVGEKLVIRGGEALQDGAAVRVQAPQGKTVLDRDKGTEVAAP